MIANLDENVAALDAMLEQAGLRDDTIVLYITDNGGTGGISVYNAGLRGAKTSLYEGGHRAACFLRWPAGKLRPAGDIDVLAECQDILPTVMELCGLQVPAGVGFDGTSLAPLLRGQTQPNLNDRKLVVQYGGLVQSAPVEWDSAVLWNRWRLVQGKEPVEADAKAVVFQGQLERGKHKLQTWFYDPSGKELCGAFYVEALRR
jgi:arylsulfatase